MSRLDLIFGSYIKPIKSPIRLTRASYPETPVGDFPCPYPDRPARNNVVRLADFRRRG